MYKVVVLNFFSRIFGFYAFGALFSVLTVEFAKYKIGRLRPYFLTVCKPDLSDENCKDENNYPIFVTNYTCEAEINVVREARKSFFSGHSSFSFYSLLFHHNCCELCIVVVKTVMVGYVMWSAFHGRRVMMMQILNRIGPIAIAIAIWGSSIFLDYLIY